MDSISIPLSKRKLFLVSLGSWAFVAICVWIFLSRDGPGNDPFNKLVAVVGILFFGLAGLFGAWKLFDKQPGLIIDAEGIVDNSSATAAGRISWAEITGFGISEVSGQKFLTIMVTSPEKYISGKGRVRAWLSSMSMKMTGSPINISANSLKTNFDGLLNLLADAGTRFKTPANRFKDTSEKLADVDGETK